MPTTDERTDPDDPEYLALGSGPIPLSGRQLRDYLLTTMPLPDLGPGNLVLDIDLAGHDVTHAELAIYIKDLTGLIEQQIQKPDSESGGHEERKAEPKPPLRQETPGTVRSLRASAAIRSIGPLQAAAEARNIAFEWVVDAENRLWARPSDGPVRIDFGLTIDPQAAAHEAERAVATALDLTPDVPKTFKVSRIRLDAQRTSRSGFRLTGRARLRWAVFSMTVHGYLDVQLHRTRGHHQVRYRLHFFSRNPVLRWVVAYLRSKISDDLHGSIDLLDEDISELSFRVDAADPGTQTGPSRQVIYIDGAVTAAQLRHGYPSHDRALGGGSEGNNADREQPER